MSTFIDRGDGWITEVVTVDTGGRYFEKPVNGFEGQTASVLYVSWAVKHLRILDECIMRIADCSNLNLCDVLTALYEQKKKLIVENINYWEAASILADIGLTCGARIEKDE